MGRTCGTNVKTRNEYKILSGELQERDHFECVDREGGLILK
jgi:hypothetical protein